MRPGYRPLPLSAQAPQVQDPMRRASLNEGPLLISHQEYAEAHCVAALPRGGRSAACLGSLLYDDSYQRRPLVWARTGAPQAQSAADRYPSQQSVSHPSGRARHGNQRFAARQLYEPGNSDRAGPKPTSSPIARFTDQTLPIALSARDHASPALLAGHLKAIDCAVCANGPAR